MRNIRPAAAAAVVLALLLTLSGCFGFPSIVGGNGNGSDTSLAGTSWSGTDSDGDAWILDFQADGTIGLTLNGEEYDDPTDTWQLSGDRLTINIEFSDGPATMTGTYSSGANSISLDGSQNTASWTLVITQT